MGCGHARLRLSGELDLASGAVLRAAVDDQLALGWRVIEIDAAGLRFCDAAGLGVLVTAQRRFQAIGGRLHLIAVSPAMARLLSITGLTGLVPRLGSPDKGPDRGLPDAAEQTVRP
jgi:anti-sigma B factor antagonist